MPFIDEKIGIISILSPCVPIPVIDSSIVELDPAILTLDDGIVVPALRTADMHDEAFEDVTLCCYLLVVELLQVDVCGEGYWMVEFDLGKSLKIEDQPLKMDEEEGRKTMKSVIFLDGFYLTLAELTEIIADNLRLDQFMKAILEISLTLDLYGKYIEIFNSFLGVIALLTVYYIDQLSFEVSIDELTLVGVL